jgi:transcriptional regulator with XRE-family HTH domain
MAVKAKKTGSALGERIREMRKKRDIAVESLAEKTGYPTEYIQQVESGEVSPPVGALIQISRALALDSAALLSEDRKKERRQSFRKRTQAYSYENLTPDAEDKHLWAYLVTLEPEKQHESVEFKHEGEEFVFVLDGKVRLNVGGEAFELKKGASHHFNSAIDHTLLNLSVKRSKLLVVVYTP